MVDYVNYNLIKQAIALTFQDKCTVVRQSTKTNPTTFVEEDFTETLHIDVPCKISYKNADVTEKNADGSTYSANKVVTLFTDPDIEIPAGCTITVTMATGDVIKLERTGLSANYVSHKEYPVFQLEDYL